MNYHILNDFGVIFSLLGRGNNLRLLILKQNLIFPKVTLKEILIILQVVKGL